MDKETNYTVIVGHSNTLNDGKKLFDLLQRENDKIKKIYLIDMGCALGVHAGPGSLVTAIQPLS